MKYCSIIFVAFLILSACGTGSTENEAIWLGEWKALWETNPASFQGIDGITHFTMDGKITFEEGKVNIKAYGFEGCAFGIDTLDHTLLWKVKNDSLILTNDESTPGMDYRIKSKSANQIELQLLEDISLTLQK